MIYNYKYSAIILDHFNSYESKVKKLINCCSDLMQIAPARLKPGICRATELDGSVEGRYCRRSWDMCSRVCSQHTICKKYIQKNRSSPRMIRAGGHDHSIHSWVGVRACFDHTRNKKPSTPRTAFMNLLDSVDQPACAARYSRSHCGRATSSSYGSTWTRPFFWNTTLPVAVE